MSTAQSNYSNTLNLPRTSFPMRAKLAQREPEILARWTEMRIYDQMQSRADGQPLYLLHDGPPYANGDIHLGQAFNKILKDFILKFKAMQGYRVPFVPGWDCHGLPVEYQLLKNLQLGKAEIDILDFRSRAREYAMRFVTKQRHQFQRLGVFGRWEKPYLTMDPSYEAEIIRAFGALAQQGYVQRRLKPIHWCWSCETALAEAEIEYKEKQSPSVYVLLDLAASVLPVAGKRPLAILVWTTTPWTLPANQAVAVHPDLEYAVVETSKSATALLLGTVCLDNESVQHALGDYRVIASVSGAQLEGIEYQKPFDEAPGKILTASFVDPEEGTGCVHIAPGHGEDDYFLGIKHGLPIFAPVDSQGRFTDEVRHFAHMQVFDANRTIQNHLRENGHLLHAEQAQHSYPHCWRCGKPVIFRATPQWFLHVDHCGLRKRALEVVNQSVTWIPRFSRARMEGMLRERPDWCLSRQRYWGLGIPVLYCASCGDPVVDHRVIARVAAQVEEYGSDIWFREGVDTFVPSGFTCPHCGCTDFGKETDILDVWFESGVSHSAVLAKEPELEDPADLYLEGSDQHRGWFQTSLLTSIGIKDRAPYREVLTHGFVVDGEGKKMSKSVGNVVDPQQLTSTYGADILRLWSALEDYSEDIRISQEILQYAVELYRRIRNSFRYLLGNLSDYSPTLDSRSVTELREVDRYILARLQTQIETITRSYERFRFHEVVQQLHHFANSDLSAFYFDVLKDRLYTSASTSSLRRSAQTVLWHLLVVLSRLVSPILAFTAEETWQHIIEKDEDSPPSVFFSPWPVASEKYSDPGLEQKWAHILSFRQEVLAALERARQEGLISSSLEARLSLVVPPETHGVLSTLTAEELKEVLIVSQLELACGDQLSIQVHRAQGSKCKRCWNYCPTVGTDSLHPLLCERCRAIVSDARADA